MGAGGGSERQRPPSLAFQSTVLAPELSRCHHCLMHSIKSPSSHKFVRIITNSTAVLQFKRPPVVCDTMRMPCPFCVPIIFYCVHHISANLFGLVLVRRTANW